MSGSGAVCRGLSLIVAVRTPTLGYASPATSGIRLGERPATERYRRPARSIPIEQAQPSNLGPGASSPGLLFAQCSSCVMVPGAGEAMPKVKRQLTSSGLTPKQQRFVDCFCICLNGTQTIIDAKFTKDRKLAASMAMHYLNDDAVSAEIRRRLDSSTAKAMLTVERIDQEIARLAFVDIRLLYDDKGVLRPMSEWPDDVAAAVGNIEVLDRIGKTGRPRIHKIKVWDKVSALTLAAKRLGMLVDKHEVDVKVSLEDLIAQSYQTSKADPT